jgi:hypothetical protein
MASNRPAPRAHLDWLTGELTYWQDEGWLDAQHADEILHSYRPVQRFTLARLLLTLGAGFLGVGLIWLVAANLDSLPPVLRFGGRQSHRQTQLGADWRQRWPSAHQQLER